MLGGLSRHWPRFASRSKKKAPTTRLQQRLPCPHLLNWASARLSFYFKANTSEFAEEASNFACITSLSNCATLATELCSIASDVRSYPRKVCSSACIPAVGSEAADYPGNTSETNKMG